MKPNQRLSLQGNAERYVEQSNSRVSTYRLPFLVVLGYEILLGHK
ncbi:hypothetical protein ACOZ9X_01880 [Fictibacillus nanhaiensis]